MEIKEIERNTTSDGEAGQWISDIPNMGDLALRVRSMNAPIVTTYRSRLERRLKPSDRERGGLLKPEASTRVMAQLLSDVVLLEWKNLTANGAVLEYKKETAYEMLLDPKYTRFLDAIVWAANEADRENNEAKEELAKN